MIASPPSASGSTRSRSSRSSASKRLAEQVHVALLNLGVVARCRRKIVQGKAYHVLDITGDAVREFYSAVGFQLARKQRRFWELPAGRNTNLDVVPHTRDLVRAVFRENAPFPREMYRRYGHQSRGDRRPSRRKLREFLEDVSPRPSAAVATLESLADPTVYWDRVESVTPERATVCDLAVPDTHAFIANGFVNHNTFVIVRLVSMYKKAKLRVALCAPTGKAARRMMDQLEAGGLAGLRASTIHSLLGPHEQDGRFVFEHGETFPLNTDVVIVDETSRVDVSLMADLLRAITPGTRLVLVGDTYQLPSVGPGRVLGDMISSGVVPSFELTKIKRQDPGRIVTNCHLIKEGRDCVFENRMADDMHFLERNDPVEVRQAVCDLVERRLPARGFDPLREVQVMSPLREKTDLSCKAFNGILQRSLNPAEPVPKCRFKVGDKVIQMRNAEIDEQPVVNGDIGYVRQITKKHVEVGFENPERIVKIPRKRNDLQLAYALTIHKMQGSEIRAVVIPVHRCFGSRMMQRNLVYTAISRARELCILVGQRSALSAAIRRNHHERRMSRLVELLTRDTEASRDPA